MSTNPQSPIPTSSVKPEIVLGALGLSSGANVGVISEEGVAARGETINSFCPSTGKRLGKVSTVSVWEAERERGDGPLSGPT